MRLLIAGVAALATATGSLVAMAQPSPQPLRPGTKLMPIDWSELREAVKNQRLLRTASLKMTLAANAPRPSLPMLLPVEQSIVAAAVHVFPRPDGYATSMRFGDITIEVHGERRALILPKGDPLASGIAPKLRAMIAGADVPLQIDKTEGGFDVTFSRFGAAYLVAIECKSAETDERCTKPDFVKSLAERMALAGPEAP
jgi:hypothetical protein